jgi:hypothetical protein
MLGSKVTVCHDRFADTHSCLCCKCAVRVRCVRACVRHGASGANEVCASAFVRGRAVDVRARACAPVCTNAVYPAVPTVRVGRNVGAGTATHRRCRCWTSWRPSTFGNPLIEQAGREGWPGWDSGQSGEWK